MAKIGFGKTLLIVFFMIMSSIWIISTIPEPVSGASNEVSGDITGTQTWSGTKYVVGHVTVKSNAKLTINAGTTVQFNGSYGLYIEPNGRLFVNGASGNRVTIFGGLAMGSWNGIYLNASSSTAYINYTHMYYSSEGVKCDDGGFLRVNDCEFDNNVFAIQGNKFDPIIKNTHIHNNTIPILFTRVNGTVQNCDIIDNTNSMIWSLSWGKPNFDDNDVVNNCGATGGTAVELQTTNIHFTNNTIKHNEGNGISLGHCSAYVYNNDILRNGRTTRNAGIYILVQTAKDTSIIDNNRINDNGRGIFGEGNLMQPESNISCVITNNDINGNVKVGVELTNYSYPKFDNNDVLNNKYGIRIQRASPVFANSTVKNSDEFDWHVKNMASPTSLNTYFDTVNITANSTIMFLKVKWFMHATVLEQGTSNPINNADVTLVPMNWTNMNVQNRKTNAQGKTEYMHVVEKVIYWGDNITYYSPFRVLADKITFPRQYVASQLDNYKLPYERTWTAYLDKNFAPSVPTGITPTKTHDTTPTVCWTASTDVNLDPIRYYLKLGTTPGGGQILQGNDPIAETCYDINTTLQYDTTYYISLKAGDNRYANSSWATANLTIHNSKPTAPTISLSPTLVYTDTDVTVTMTAPSTDDPDEVSTYGETIRYSVTVDINDVRIPAYDKNYVPAAQVGFIIGHNDFNKGDVVNVTVTPYDGHGTDWENSGTSGAYKHPGNGTSALTTFTVLNHAPETNSTNDFVNDPDIEMNEDTIYVIPTLFEYIFQDPDKDKLKFEYVGNPNIDVDYNKDTGQLTIIPKANYFTPSASKDQLTFKANDSSGGIKELIVYVTVKEVNDPPIINVDPLQVAYQDKRHYINITISDPADPHDSGKLTLKTNHTDWSFGDKITLVENSKSNITLYFTPTNDDIGVYYLQIEGYDTKEKTYYDLEVTVQNVNDAPEVPVLITPLVSGNKAPSIYNTTQEIDFEATTYDPDLKWGDSLSYIWRSNISGLTLGNKDKFKTKVNLGGHHEITIEVKDQAGETNEYKFEMFVVDPFAHDIPQTELIYPQNNMNFPSTTPNIPITLTWEPRYHKYSDLFVYQIQYWEDDPNTDPTNINNIKDTKYTLNVQVEKTYYWQVLPSLGGTEEGVTGQCFSGKWSFTVQLVTEIKTPEVTLETPLDNSKINTSSVELTWSSEDENADSYFYQVFIDENPTPSNLVENYLTGTSYSYSGLEHGKTYYWTVVPYFGSKPGTAINGPFKFEVDIEFDPNPEIVITPDEKEFDMEPTDTKDFTYTIENTGNTIENLIITIEPDTILENFIVADKIEWTTTLNPGEKETVTFTVNLQDAAEGRPRIRLKVISNDKDISERFDIYINVNAPEEGEGDEKASATTLILALIVIIIVVALIALFFIFRKPKKKEEEEEEERVPAKISARPVMAGAPPIAKKPAVAPAAEPAKMPAAKAEAAPKPQLAPSIAVKEKVEPAPQLPPGEGPKAAVPTAAPAAAPTAATPAAVPKAEEAGKESAGQNKCPTCGSDIPAGVTECPICAAKIK